MPTMGRHRARREALRDRLPDDPAEGPASDPLRLTPWRVLAGAVIPAVLLVFLFAVVATRWRQVALFVVPPVAEIVLFLLAFAAWRPPRWVDRWHGRLLVVGAVLGMRHGCLRADQRGRPGPGVRRVQSRPGPWGGWRWPGWSSPGPPRRDDPCLLEDGDGWPDAPSGRARLSRRALEQTFE
jgi:hypothetical protein